MAETLITEGFESLEYEILEEMLREYDRLAKQLKEALAN